MIISLNITDKFFDSETAAILNISKTVADLAASYIQPSLDGGEKQCTVMSFLEPVFPGLYSVYCTLI